mmetsp:Transcript_85138/g.214684  ORF Transcript_85138/g.214684 Transcript_85138/m.214684 type:complete len:310 (-) Transcript_85138:69-998(-)|eukprot:CAMPEP_0115215508 /NCGR_PEP_ID=MMETSP0270-20121206/24853_1 /TAXON_ID=71861 /ORGANISM="Scrippsiella trochoidea, Strain CCMP3099" /LENGTH=309 /DNA_ID=CAMNT_0002629305 /DNA_START=36 /DNA_END=965 /DNA_ORIENTATION=-
MALPPSFVLLGLLCMIAPSLRASAFPVGPLDLGKLFDEIKNGPPSLAKDLKVTKEIVSHLRIFFSAKDHAIVVEPSDLTGLHESLPDMQLDGDCKHKVTAESPKASGEILHGSSLMFGVNKIQWQDVEVFADALLDASSEVDTDAKIEVGQPWSALGKHHCSKLGQKTFGLKVKSQGKVSLGMNASCSNARIEKASGGKAGFDLVFTFKVEHIGMVMPNWQTQVDASDCKVEFMGIKLGSYCGIVEKKVREGVLKAVLQVNTVSAPAISARLEQLLQAKIGSEVRIPLIHVPASPVDGSHILETPELVV